MLTQLVINLLLLIIVLTDQGCEECNMRFNTTNSNSINGLYQHPKYYCVWTEGKSFDEIMTVTMHEWVHREVMTKKEQEHFIGK